MGRINTNVQSLIAQRVLNQNSQSLNTSLERLSTGLKINRGKDDPAGLIASQNLAADQAGLNAAIGNAQRTDQVANIAEGGLQEVSGLLTDLQGLLTSSASKAGISDEEKQANQLQIDSILQTIDRVSSATSFQGIKLLNGNFDFKTSGVAAGVTDYHGQRRQVLRFVAGCGRAGHDLGPAGRPVPLGGRHVASTRTPAARSSSRSRGPRAAAS